MTHPDDRKYSKDHEWVAIDGEIVTIGVSHFAQDQLGEVVYVDLGD
ncbi:MAG: glycine cleavage system protein H, partial [Coriobacteriia bacterium]|nr:glycine cleavage system protein H [Coriobacteriia bacterium]